MNFLTIDKFINIFFIFIVAQPPGVPEICKKSLVSCPANGGLELFIIGKNFLKDTRVVFQLRQQNNNNDINNIDSLWEEHVIPDKEYLQQVFNKLIKLIIFSFN